MYLAILETALFVSTQRSPIPSSVTCFRLIFFFFGSIELFPAQIVYSELVGVRLLALPLRGVEINSPPHSRAPKTQNSRPVPWVSLPHLPSFNPAKRKAVGRAAHAGGDAAQFQPAAELGAGLLATSVAGVEQAVLL
jgi:hypothetical protein